MLAANGVKDIPTINNVLHTWQLGGLARALASPVEEKPHKRGGVFGSELAAMFSKELM